MSNESLQNENPWIIEESKILHDRLCATHPDSDSENDSEDVELHDMELFCHAIGEPQLADKFTQQRVALSQLLHFNEQDLINCGIELIGERKKVLSSIGQMHSEKWSPASLNDMTEQSLLSSPGIYLALNDINKHLEYIGVTFVYLRKRIDENPQILELGKDFVGVKKIAQELEDLTKTSCIMHYRLKALDRHLTKYTSKKTLHPANLIDRCYIKAGNLQQFTMKLGLGIVLVCASLKIFHHII